MTMRRPHAAIMTTLLAGGFLVLAAGSARGQAPDPSASATFQVGPLAFTPALAIPALGLDSNVFNESENPRQDFTANVQPAGDAWLRFERMRLHARQQFNLLYFDKYASQRAVNTFTTLRAEVFLLWATPYVSASYVRTNDRADARIDTRAVNRSRPATAGIDFRLSSSTNLDLSANDNTVRFDAGATFEGTPLRSALDRNTRIYRATVRYAVTPPTTLTLTAARQQERFRFATQQNSDSFRIVPGITLATDAVITGRLEVGYMSFKPRGPSLRAFSGVVSNVDLGYVFLGLTRLQLGVNRDLMPSIDSITSYALQTAVTGTVTHRVTERWDVNASARRQRLDFGQVSVAPVVEPDEPDGPRGRVDTIDTYGGGIGFYFNQGLRLGLRVESISRKSALRAGRYDNLRILSSISYDLN